MYVFVYHILTFKVVFSNFKRLEFVYVFVLMLVQIFYLIFGVLSLVYVEKSAGFGYSDMLIFF